MLARDSQTQYLPTSSGIGGLKPTTLYHHAAQLKPFRTSSTSNYSRNGTRKRPRHRVSPDALYSVLSPVPCLCGVTKRPVANNLLPLVRAIRGTGYIGSFTALALLEAGYNVVIADSLYNSSDEVLNRIELICGKRPGFFKLDVTDEAAFDRLFEENPDIDSVIHFAALKVIIICRSTAVWVYMLIRC